MTTILVVEDDAALRRLISYRLDKKGYEVLESPDGADALALLAEKGHQIDLIVVDLDLPEMDGFEVARRIEADPMLKTIPILLCTGRPRAEISEGMHTGGDDFINKPFSVKKLGLRVDVLLDKHETAQGG